MALLMENSYFFSPNGSFKWGTYRDVVQHCSFKWRNDEKCIEVLLCKMAHFYGEASRDCMQNGSFFNGETSKDYM